MVKHRTGKWPPSAAAFAAVASILAITASWPLSAADVTKQRLEDADLDPSNWITIFQNYSSHHFSRLNQITRENVAKLKVAFTVPLSSAVVGNPTGANLENAPLVDDGMAYLDDGWGGLYKIDLRPGNDEGRVVWFADAAVSKDEQARTRGMALWGKNAYKDLVDGRVVAVNRESGEFVWDIKVARVPRPESVVGSISTLELLKGEQFTAAPLAVEGKILVGQSFGDRANRGWLQAISADTGKELWRTYTVPGPGEPGHETWKDKNNAWKTGGASLWTTGSYDPAQRVTIWGTANAIPQIDVMYRPGDNLYSDSVLAFDIDTGKIKWFFQYVPNEGWDYDENGVNLLYDVVFDGVSRKMMGHYGRNGFFYQLDRTSGSFVSGTQYVNKINWTKGLDPKTGKPVEYDPKLDIQVYLPESRWYRTNEMKVVCPTALGGVRWQPPSFDPKSQIAYSGGIDGCEEGRSVQSLPVPGGQGGIIATGQPVPGGGFYDGWHGGPHNSLPGTHGLITAIQATTGKMVASLSQPYENLSGVTATSGGLVFTGNLDGSVTAHNSETLAELWRFNTRISIKAPVISYAIAGKQYVAVIAGGQAAPSAKLHPELKTMGPGAVLYVFSL